MSNEFDVNDPIPEDAEGRARLLQTVLLRACEGHRGPADAHAYIELRRVMRRDPELERRLPEFVLAHRDLPHLWSYIKDIDPKWEPRRKHVRDALAPLFDHLQAVGARGETKASEALKSLDAESVYAVWQKALERRHSDPEGAIACARTLLETVCKHVLDERDITYSETLDLPVLVKMTAEQLNLAPTHHSETAFKRILVGAASVIEGLGSLRSRIDEAHGHGRRPARPVARHAQLAVGMAGAAATFIIETWEARVEDDFLDLIDESKGG
jgi:hypothetical protein